MIRRKFQIRISEQEEQVESLMARCTALEKQKSRLQSEVEVLIIDLEKVFSDSFNIQNDFHNTCNMLIMITKFSDYEKWMKFLRNYERPC